NEHHSQSYYPDIQYFENYPQQSVTLSGTLLPFETFVEDDNIVLPMMAFGYADNRPINAGVDRTIPDNPYTPDVAEGAGGDAIDISWAVDTDGNYIDLDEIHFVKIATGVLADIGALGEVSTEICDIVATKSSGTTAKKNLTVIHPHAKTMLVGDELKIYAFYFHEGRKADYSMVFENSDGNKADIKPDGTVVAKAGGSIRVSAYPEGSRSETQTTEIYISEPKSLRVEGVENSIFAGNIITIAPFLYDQDNMEITNIKWIISVENEDIIQIEDFNLIGMKIGKTSLTVYPEKFPALSKKFQIEVKPAAEKIDVRITVKTVDENLLPLKKLSLTPFSINSFVENRQNDYGSPNYVSLAQVITAALQNAAVTFKFRDDAAANSKLYLYCVENEGLFTYGWGGKTDPEAYARTWIARLNSQNHFNDFDKIPVADGDTIVLYHVGNILDNWKLSVLTASPDLAVEGDITTLIYRIFDCSLQPNGSISQSAGYPLTNKSVTANDDSHIIAVTDNSGKTKITLEQSPPLIFRSGSDAVFIAKSLITSVNKVENSDYKIYPNPATDRLFITGLIQDCTITISDSLGKILLSTTKNASADPVMVQHLNRGIYFLLINDGSKIYRYKFVKH
ncbi:MAG: T9SS type A sorting domain-containing protein, partial [Prolixibacteraceae bacterium]|nr:T9SS type A sorting domain-containing protein [Prolixibacteraceae bacterium]